MPIVFGAQNSSSQGDSVSSIVCPTLDKSKTPAVSYGIPGNWIGRKPENGGNAVEPMIDVAPCQTTTDRHGVAYSVGADCYNGAITGDIACTMSTYGSGAGTSGPTVMLNMAVRRLTPTECERLQGFPDGYTQTPHNGKPASDGPRYKALGNSMAVPVMAWIGKRIQKVELL